MKNILLVGAVSTLVFCGFTVKAAAPNISGDVDINVKADNIINTAIASNTKAEIIIGSMVSGSVGGFKTSVTVKTVTNIATGAGSCSQVVIGSVGHQEC